MLRWLSSGVGGLFFFRADVFALPAATETRWPAQLVTVVTLTLWAFLGLECATIPAGSVRDPARTIPLRHDRRHVADGVDLHRLDGWRDEPGPADALATSTAPFADGARRLLGDRRARFVALGAAISCLGALNGWVLDRRPAAAWRWPTDGLFPAVFGRLSARGTPARGMIIAGVLASMLVAMNYSRGLVALFTFIILLARLSTLVPYAFCALAVWLMPGQPTPTARRPSSACSPSSTRCSRSVGAGAETVFYGFLLLLAGLPVYVWMRRGAAAPSERASTSSIACRASRSGTRGTLRRSRRRSSATGARSTSRRRRIRAGASISTRHSVDLLRRSGTQVELLAADRDARPSTRSTCATRRS